MVIHRSRAVFGIGAVLFAGITFAACGEVNPTDEVSVSFTSQGDQGEGIADEPDSNAVEAPAGATPSSPRPTQSNSSTAGLRGPAVEAGALDSSGPQVDVPAEATTAIDEFLPIVEEAVQDSSVLPGLELGAARVDVIEPPFKAPELPPLEVVRAEYISKDKELVSVHIQSATRPAWNSLAEDLEITSASGDPRLEQGYRRSPHFVQAVTWASSPEPGLLVTVVIEKPYDSPSQLVEVSSEQALELSKRIAEGLRDTR
ncbi:MAG: hypothetical protein ACE367_02750 [Acidimicrobiales bacterium]